MMWHPKMGIMLHYILDKIWTYMLLYLVGFIAQVAYHKIITAVQVNDLMYRPTPKWLKKINPMIMWIAKRNETGQT